MPVSFRSETTGQATEPRSPNDSTVDQVKQLLYNSRLLSRIINATLNSSSYRVTPSVVTAIAILEHANHLLQSLAPRFRSAVVSHADQISYRNIVQTSANRFGSISQSIALNYTDSLAGSGSQHSTRVQQRH
jgi:hypothetical protein